MPYSISNLIQTTTLDKLDAKILLRHILNFSRAQLITNSDYVLNDAELAKFLDFSNLRNSGMPINYITGTREFYSREFIVTKDTLIPRPETELLVDTILEFAKPNTSLLDLGTGSGCIAISAKLERETLLVSAVDKSSAALEVAKQNASNLGADIKFYHSDWFSDVSGKFDIIVSNPPYIHPDDKHLQNLLFEPKTALTDFEDGLSCLRAIITKAKDYLQTNGILMVEHGYDQGASVRELFTTNGYKAIATIVDYSKNDRITLGVLGAT